jgi:DNA-binding transcriptional MerR regulator
VTPKLYKAAEVCELAQLQSYVLRSWEKEFPGIGVQKSPESPRLYRQSDLEQVQRIKQLVFAEGLTLAGARRRLEALAPTISSLTESEVTEVLDSLGADAWKRIAVVREGLRELHSMLSGAPGSSNGGRRSSVRADLPASAKATAGEQVRPKDRQVREKEFALKPPPATRAPVKARPAAMRSKTVKRGSGAKSSTRKGTPTTKRVRGGRL